jgi:alpha-1,2-mannosyltransferase
VVFALTAARHYLSFDIWTANYASWQLGTRGTTYLDGVSIPEMDHSPLRWVWIQDAPNGHTVITRAPIVVIAGVPAYFLTQPDTMTVAPAALTAAALTALAVVLMYRAVCSFLQPRHAMAAAIVFAFTTPVWSVAANGLWPQTITVLGIAVVAWAAASERYWVMGFGGVLLLWARPHAALIVAILALTLAWKARRVGIAVRAGLPGLASLPLLCLWTHWIYGSWSPFPLFGAGAFASVHQSMLSLPDQAGMWIAPDRGILVYTPLMLVLLPALLRTWSQLPTWATALLVSGLAYTVLQSALGSFVGGDPIYGYRYGMEFLACATPAFAAAAPHVRGLMARLAVPVLALQFTVILLGAVVERVALPYAEAWTNNAFVSAMVEHAPALPLLAALVLGASIIGMRKWLSDGRAGPEAQDWDSGTAARSRVAVSP